ncbi:MAG: ABC transporter permease [Flavobacteriales bacterium]|nr:ABC transporter permease [Flavobacteriales bacterium]
MTAQYKQTILGPLWQVVQPLLTSLMFALIFGLMARMSIPGIPPLLFYMSGVVPWTFFSGVINRTSTTLTTNAPLMTKVYFPRLVSPMATTISTMVGFVVQIIFFFVVAFLYRISGAYPWQPGIDLLWLPVLIVLQIVMAFGIGLLVSALTVRFRDLGILIVFLVQLLMYMSPVIFPLSRTVEGSLTHRIVISNPMTPIIEGFRASLLGTPMDAFSLWYPAVFGFAVLAIGLSMFQRVQRQFADVI